MNNLKLTPGLLFLLAGLAALGNLSTNIILPSFSAIATSFGVTIRELGLTITSFFAAFAMGQLLVGPLSDRFGRKWTVLAGSLVFIAGSLLCANADSLQALVTGRFLQAIGACATSVMSRAIARDLFEGKALSRVLAMTMIAMAAAPGFSPLLGSLLENKFGWHASFVFAAVLAAVLALQLQSSLGETLPADRRASIRLRSTSTQYLRLAVEPQFVRPATTVALITGALYALFTATPPILLDEFGFTPLQFGIFSAATVIVVFAAGLGVPRLAVRFGERPVITTGLSIVLASGLLFLCSAGATLPGFVISTAVFLFGMGLASPLATALTLQPFADRAGSAAALLGFSQSVASAIGAVLISTIQLSPGILIGAFATLAATVSLLVLRRRPT